MCQERRKSERVIDRTIVEQVTDLLYLGNIISEFKTDVITKTRR
jgi:hypothetical protein